MLAQRDCAIQVQDEEEEDNEKEGVLDDVLVPSGGMQLDPAVMSTLPPSMQVWVLAWIQGYWKMMCIP